MKRLLVVAAAAAGAAYAALEARKNSHEQQLWAEATDPVPSRSKPAQQ